MRGRGKDDDLRTAGELRRRLDEMGNPWTVTPSLSDDDVLPARSRGGQADTDVPDADRIPVSDLDQVRAHLLMSGPPNVYLRELWIEEGLVPVNRADDENANDVRDASDDGG